MADVWTILQALWRYLDFLCIANYAADTVNLTLKQKFMKFKQIMMWLSASACIVACSKPDLSVFEAPVSPYAGVAALSPVEESVQMRVDQKYRTLELTLDEIGVTVADDAVFYAPSASGEWFGEDWYTSEYGFYMDSKGNACHRSDLDARMFIEYYPAGTNGASKPTIAIGQIPDACTIGQTYTLNVGFATAVSRQPISISVTIGEALPWAKYIEHEDGLTYTVYQEVNTDYLALEIPVNETAIMNALGLDTLSPLLDAMQGDTAYDTTMRGVNADGSYDAYNKYTANVAGYWFDQNGNVCEWKGEKWGAFIEWDRTSPMIFRLGQAVENNVVGSRYDMKIALIYGDKEAVLTFRLAIVAEVTDELGLL